MAESDMVPCPVPGCERRRSSQYMMCRSDWWRVKADTRAEVYAKFDAYSAATGQPEPAEWRHAREAYHEVRDEAIRQAVESRARAMAKAVSTSNG